MFSSRGGSRRGESGPPEVPDDVDDRLGPVRHAGCPGGRTVALDDDGIIHERQQVLGSYPVCQPHRDRRTKCLTIEGTKQVHAQASIDRAADEVVATPIDAPQARSVEGIEETVLGRRSTVLNAKQFLILAQFCEPSPKERQVTVARHLLDRHVAEADDLYVQSLSDAVEALHHVDIRPPKFDCLITRYIACTGHIKAEVSGGDEHRPAVFADERMIESKLVLEHFELPARVAGTQHQRYAFKRQRLECCGGGGEGMRLRIEEHAVHVGEHHNSGVGLHRVTLTIACPAPQSHPVRAVFVVTKPWSRGSAIDRGSPRDKMADVRHRLLEGLTIKAALAIGFGLTFGLWLFAGYYFTRRMADVQREAAAINLRYMQAQELLSTVRTQVLLGSVYVRDALLDPDPRTADDYRRQLQDTYRSIDQVLRQYVPVLDSAAERERVGRLRREIDDFRSTLTEILASDTSRWPSEARMLLRTRIVPKREVVIRVSEEVQTLNRNAFVQQQTGITEIYRGTQRRVWQQLGLALLASLGIAVLATLYAGRLEDRLRRQRAKDAENTRDLQRLSAQLIKAQEEERRSIARELHDEVGQVLTAIKVELAVAQRAIEAGDGSGRVLEDARSITDGALQTVRDLSHLLHPALLDDLGLPAAIEWYVRGFSRRHGVRVDVLHEGMEERLVPETEATAYRIVQEALTNVAKHAQATSCRVYVQRLPNTVLITIEDDGVGFLAADAQQESAHRGLGLIGIRERVSHLRGTVRLETAPGRGTRLTVELPARARAAGDGADEAEPAPPERQLVDQTVVDD